jgi:diacylglycerol O-acyltransferase/trehalose O-mycolyltransferase
MCRPRIRHGARAAMLASAAMLALTPVGSADAAAAPVTPPIRVVAEERAGDRMVDLTVQSSALGRVAKVRLLVPDGWKRRKPGATWPVLYLFHAAADTYET